jgi:glutamate/tyrosine decarboxylase-like PLP-dependent enzyme
MYTPTFAGTRPGGAIAAAWAVLNYLGREGYEARARQILDARTQLVAGCRDLGFELFGDPKVSIVAFGWPEGDILAVGEGLYEDGWFSSRVQNPDGIQCMISPEHQKTIGTYLAVLEKHRDDVTAGRRSRSQREVKYS